MRHFLDLRFDIAGGGLQPSAGSAAERVYKDATDVYLKVNGLKGYRQQSQILVEDVKSLLDAILVAEKGDQFGTEGRSKATSGLERLLASIGATLLNFQRLSLKEYARRGKEFEAQMDDYRKELAQCFQLSELKGYGIWISSSPETCREARQADALYLEEMTKLFQEASGDANAKIAGAKSLLTDNLDGEAYFQQLNSYVLQDEIMASQLKSPRPTELDIYWNTEIEAQKELNREKPRRAEYIGVDARSGASVIAERASRNEVLPKAMANRKIEDLRQCSHLQCHNHIAWVEIFVVGHSELELYFVTQRYRNGNILHFLSKQEDPASCDITKWLYQIATAIAFLHSLQPSALHCSIQGENILLDDHLNARLSNPLFPNQPRDSGAYKSPYSSSWPREGLRWRAPEVLFGGEPSEASAVWSFGITAVELLTGHRPMTMVQDHYLLIRYRDGRQPPPLRKKEYRLHRPTEPFSEPGGVEKICLSPPVGYCSDGRRLDDAWASLISCCFVWKPDQRMDISEVVQNLKTMRHDL